jgi:deoxyuridine 5'-triphosphate nucleotidohydrolase
MINTEALSLLKPRIVEIEPGWAPRPANQGDVGADLKLYIEPGKEERYRMYGAAIRADNLVVDGKLVEPEDYYATQALVDTSRIVVLRPGQTRTFHAGFKIAVDAVASLAPLIPVYYIVSRSGLSTKFKVSVTNRPGVIDPVTYRGWVKVSLENTGVYTHVFTHGARIAQGILDLVIDQSYWSPEELIVESLEETVRGTGGFGSTGV